MIHSLLILLNFAARIAFLGSAMHFSLPRQFQGRISVSLPLLPNAINHPESGGSVHSCASFSRPTLSCNNKSLSSSTYHTFPVVREISPSLPSTVIKWRRDIVSSCLMLSRALSPDERTREKRHKLRLDWSSLRPREALTFALIPYVILHFLTKRGNAAKKRVIPWSSLKYPPFTVLEGRRENFPSFLTLSRTPSPSEWTRGKKTHPFIAHPHVRPSPLSLHCTHSSPSPGEGERGKTVS